MKQKKERLMLTLSIVVILSFGISTIFSIYSLNSLVSQINKEKSIIFSNDISSSINSIFSEPKGVARSINNPVIRYYVKNAGNSSVGNTAELLKPYLNHIVNYFNYDTAFVAPISNLHYYTEYGDSKTIDYSNPDDDWYEAFLESGDEYELNVDNDQANENRTTVYINVRMEDEDGNPIGACGLGLTMDDISRKIESYESQKGYNIMLVSPDGKIQVASNTDYTKGSLSRDSEHVFKKVSEEIKKELDSFDRSKSYKYIQRNKDSFYIIKYISDCKWFLVIDYSGNSLPSASFLVLKNLVACILSLLIVLGGTNLIMNKLNKRIAEFKKTSEFDSMTGLMNRHAFDERKKNLGLMDSLEKISVAVFDIDSLKRVNDNIGHSAGDELIKGAAKIIKDFFEKDGQVYRVGGDEFIVILETPFESVKNRIKDFKNQVSLWKGTQVDSLHVSIGIVPGYIYQYMKIDELIELADKEMYEDKRKYYESMGIERRTR